MSVSLRSEVLGRDVRSKNCKLTYLPLAQIPALDLAGDEANFDLYMLRAWLGLTDIYSLVQDPAVRQETLTSTRTSNKILTKLEKQLLKRNEGCTLQEAIEGILELRRLHVARDTAVRDAHGWHDLDLGHDFHEVESLAENDRVSYTISPEARREVLKRLLEENHRRAALEAQAAPAGRKPKGQRKQQRKQDADNTGYLY